MNYIILEVLRAFWVLMPIYTSNILAALSGGRIPIDAGMTLGGKRIFGDGKTAEGFVTGFLSGLLVASLQYYIQPLMPVYMRFLSQESVVVLPFLAVFGDSLGSFVKRRLGMERGEMALFLDQLDFSLLPLAYLLFINSIPLVTFFVSLSLTMPLHMISNMIAFKLGVKKEPW